MLYDGMSAGVLAGMSATAFANGNNLKATALGKKGANGGNSRNMEVPSAAAEDNDHSYRRQQLDKYEILMPLTDSIAFSLDRLI